MWGKYFLSWFITTMAFISLDMIWLGIIAKEYYFRHLSYLATVKNDGITFNLPVGILTQAIIATCLFITISVVHLLKPDIKLTIAMGVFIGFSIYATYDLTNLSYIKNWPVELSLVDIAWGCFQGATAGILVFWLHRLVINS